MNEIPTVSALFTMLLLIAFAFYALLLYRIGLFEPLQEHREALTFEHQVLQLAEDLEWEDRMIQARQRWPQRYEIPTIQLRTSRSRR